VKRECGVKYYVFNKHAALPVVQFSKSDMSIHASLVLYIPGTGFEVLTVGRIHSAVWVRTLCSVVHGYGFSGGTFLVCLCRQSEDGGHLSREKPQCRPVRLHSPITQETLILNYNILLFPCIASLLQNN
jgi:hypothetical protein